MVRSIKDSQGQGKQTENKMNTSEEGKVMIAWCVCSTDSRLSLLPVEMATQGDRQGEFWEISRIHTVTSPSFLHHLTWACRCFDKQVCCLVKSFLSFFPQKLLDQVLQRHGDWGKCLFTRFISPAFSLPEAKNWRWARPLQLTPESRAWFSDALFQI